MKSVTSRGFTLIEVLVALTIGALVLLGARALLDGLAASARATVRGAAASDEGANAEWITRQVVGNMALAPDTLASFVGTPRDAAFASWCPSPRGELESCTAHLSLSGDSSIDLVLTLVPGGTVKVIRSASRARLRYLRRADDGGAWQPDWRTSIDTPLAIGLINDRDTLLFRVGERR